MKSSSPLKENAYNSPRALIYYYYGEKTLGTASIEQEMASGPNDSAVSPLKDRYSNNSKHYSAQKSSSEKKSTSYLVESTTTYTKTTIQTKKYGGTSAADLS
jgi:hypothetical protein